MYIPAGIENYFRNQTEKIKTRIELVNLDRKTSQEAFQPILLQLNYKRDQLVFKCMQIERRCEELEAMCSRDEVTAAGMEAARGGLKRDAGEELEDAQSKRSRVA